MNVASLKLCKELHDLSGWEYDTTTVDYVYYTPTEADMRGPITPILFSGQAKREIYPGAYSLGYLLRKLPRYIDKTRLTIQPTNQEQWCASYDYENGDCTRDCFGDSLEDAAAKLCIELFNQGILTREEK